MPYFSLPDYSGAAIKLIAIISWFAVLYGFSSVCVWMDALPSFSASKQLSHFAVLNRIESGGYYLT